MLSAFIICRCMCACTEILWMCVLYVSFGCKVRPTTFRCVAMGRAVLFILRSLLYSAGSGVNRVQVVSSGFSASIALRPSRCSFHRICLGLCMSEVIYSIRSLRSGSQVFSLLMLFLCVMLHAIWSGKSMHLLFILPISILCLSAIRMMFV